MKVMVLNSALQKIKRSLVKQGKLSNSFCIYKSLVKDLKEHLHGYHKEVEGDKIFLSKPSNEETFKLSIYT